ncbi:MAG: phosphate signaling complex protein PhoU, partial [Neisseria sp.]|nr:phosphate signaling complex protein PhoU [Neisseria sp.]
MPQRISSHFDQELEQVRNDVLRMGKLIEQQLYSLLNAMQQTDLLSLQNIADADSQINRLELEIDDACQTILARRQPAASDLRLVLTISRIIVDLERMGDELKKIALAAHALFNLKRVSPNALYDTHRLASMTAPMIHRALQAFSKLDANVLQELKEADKRLDTDYRNQARTIITYMMEEPRNIGVWVEVMMMNKAIERIGDHAKNIAEHTVYLVQGVDVR